MMYEVMKTTFITLQLPVTKTFFAQLLRDDNN